MHKDLMAAAAALPLIFGAAGGALAEEEKSSRKIDICGRVVCHLTWSPFAVIRSGSETGGYLIKRMIEGGSGRTVPPPAGEIVQQPDLFRG